VKLNPYATSLRRSEVLAERRRAATKAARLTAARDKKAVPEAPGSRRDSAIARSHEPQQIQNYRRLIQGEGYAAPIDKEGVKVKVASLKKARAPIAGNSLKKSEKKKVRKVKVKKVEQKEEKKTAIVIPAGPLKRIKAPKEIKVKKAAKPKKEGGDKKAKEGAKKEEGGKKEDPKKGGKEEAKKDAGKKEEAKKDGGKKK